MKGSNSQSHDQTPVHPAFRGPSPTALLIQAKFASAGIKPAEPTPWKPTPFFFYGTLMDPEILQAILGLPEPPQFQRGTISRFRIKMWGNYPALVKAEEETVEGMVWEVQTEEQLRQLQRYETSAYTPCNCIVDLEDGSRMDFARTFVWSGHADGRELKDGGFDILRYQKYFKPSIAGKRGAGD